MEKATRGLPESPARRAARIARVGARYGFGFVFGRRFIPRRGREEPGRVGARLRLSFEELGPTYVELGRFLSARGDLLPPDVTAELGSAIAGIRAVSPVEVRALLERELGNTVERLFLELDETPVRTGVFTQSHRAILPGGRPALVVVNRPGIRRDLLAMRPAADITRRRLEDRLPLNPVAAVSEFTAHAAQRRDMYFAAQTASRMSELEELRVPNIYRGYSTGRCITFEAPAASAPDAEQYRRIANAIVRLALVEGIFLSDITPERFAVRDDELWLADPTEVFALDSERQRGIAEVLAAVRREDVEGMVRNLPLTGCAIPDDTTDLRRELREMLGLLGGPLWREHSLREVRNLGLEALRKGNSALQSDVAMLVRSLAEAESLGEDPESAAGYTAIEPAVESAGETISHFRDPRRVLSRTTQRLAHPETYADYPRQVHAFLEELRDGEVEVSFRHAGLDDLISKVDILANRLVFAFLIAALIIGSSMLGIFSHGGLQILGVSIFGLIGFVFAAILGLALLIGIIRSGRL